MIEKVILGVILLYFLLGIMLWFVAIKTYGGKAKYKDFLKGYITGIGHDFPTDLMYYTGLILFIFAWPFFIRRGINE